MRIKKTVLMLGLLLVVLTSVVGASESARRVLMYKGPPPPHNSYRQAKIAEIAKLIQHVNPKAKYKRKIATAVYDLAHRYSVERQLVLATIMQESTFDYTAVGEANEKGLMQVTSTAWVLMSTKKEKEQMTDMFSIQDNIEIGIRYLVYARLTLVPLYIEAYGMDYEAKKLMSAGYNRGPWTVAAILDEGGNPLNGYVTGVFAKRRRILDGNYID